MAANIVNWSSLSSGEIRTLNLYDSVSNPDGEILHFNDSLISAANVRILQLDDTLTRFSVRVGSKTVTLLIDALTVTTSNITFANGSLLLVGDNSYQTIYDHGDN